MSRRPASRAVKGAVRLGPRGSAPSLAGGGGGQPGLETLTLDFANSIYNRNGVLYGSLTATPDVTFSRASAGYDLLGSASFAIDAPRITAVGLLLEIAATNINLRSQFDSSWGNSNSTITFNNQVAPDGATTAARLVENGTTSGHDSSLDESVGPGMAAVRYVQSLYAKRVTGTRNLKLFMANPAFSKTADGGFDLSNGTVNIASEAATWTAGVASAYAAAQSYYRCANSFVVNAIETGQFPVMKMMSGTSDSYAGDSASSLALWGAQVELAAAAGYFKDSPSSLIVTTGASATRAADALSVTVPTGTTSATITFSDNSTKVQAVTGGAAWDVAATVATHVAANVVAPVLKSITFA